MSAPYMLKKILKKHGEIIWGFANGIDVSVVQSEAPANKGYGNSTTIAFDVTDASTAKIVLLALAETVSARLREADVKAQVIAVCSKQVKAVAVAGALRLGLIDTLVLPQSLAKQVIEFNE